MELCVAITEDGNGNHSSLSEERSFTSQALTAAPIDPLDPKAAPKGTWHGLVNHCEYGLKE